MLLARPSVAHHAIAPAGMTDSRQALLDEMGCNIAHSTEQLPAIIDKVGEIGMLYVDASATDDAYALLRAALPHTNKNSIIVVDIITISIHVAVVVDIRGIITFPKSFALTITNNSFSAIFLLPYFYRHIISEPLHFLPYSTLRKMID